jgi:hypothetical protein
MMPRTAKPQRVAQRRRSSLPLSLSLSAATGSSPGAAASAMAPPVPALLLRCRCRRRTKQTNPNGTKLNAFVAATGPIGGGWGARAAGGVRRGEQACTRHRASLVYTLPKVVAQFLSHLSSNITRPSNYKGVFGYFSHSTKF